MQDDVRDSLLVPFTFYVPRFSHASRFTFQPFNPFTHPMFISQIPTPPPGSIEAWIIPAAAVLSLVALAKKLLPARRSDESFATKAELNHELGAVRDKIDARFLTLTEKLDHLGTNINDRFAKLEAAVARLRSGYHLPWRRVHKSTQARCFWSPYRFHGRRKGRLHKIRQRFAYPRVLIQSAGQLLQRIQFATDVNPIAKIAYGLYKGKFLNAVSVGFIPLRWENGTDKSGYRRKYLEQELLEVSAVGIPANPNALALAYKSGAVEKSDLRETYDLLRLTLEKPASRREQLQFFVRQLHSILKS